MSRATRGAKTLTPIIGAERVRGRRDFFAAALAGKLIASRGVRSDHASVTTARATLRGRWRRTAGRKLAGVERRAHRSNSQPTQIRRSRLDSRDRKVANDAARDNGELPLDARREVAEPMPASQTAAPIARAFCTPTCDWCALTQVCRNGSGCGTPSRRKVSTCPLRKTRSPAGYHS